MLPQGGAWRAIDGQPKASEFSASEFLAWASVRIDEQTLYEPDALVRCGPRLPGDGWT
jgi:hypothetical protein